MLTFDPNAPNPGTHDVRTGTQVRRAEMVFAHCSLTAGGALGRKEGASKELATSDIYK